MANSLRWWRDANVLRKRCTCSINWLTLTLAASSPWKYCCVAYELSLVISRIVLLS